MTTEHPGCVSMLWIMENDGTLILNVNIFENNFNVSNIQL